MALTIVTDARPGNRALYHDGADFLRARRHIQSMQPPDIVTVLFCFRGHVKRARARVDNGCSGDSNLWNNVRATIQVS